MVVIIIISVPHPLELPVGPPRVGADLLVLLMIINMTNIE